MSKKLYRKTTKNNQPKLDELAAFNSDCTFSDSAVLGYDASDESIKPLTSIDNFEINNLTVHCNTTLEGPVTACCCITTPAATITDLSTTNITNSCTITTENVDVCDCVNVACDVNIGRNLYVCGTEYITDIEQVKSCCDKILLRDGAVSGLAVGCLSGIEVNKYDGTNNTCIGVDNCGTLRIGDAGTCLEPVFTRDEAVDMNNQGLVYWDCTGNKAKTISLPASDDQILTACITSTPTTVALLSGPNDTKICADNMQEFNGTATISPYGTQYAPGFLWSVKRSCITCPIPPEWNDCEYIYVVQMAHGHELGEVKCYTYNFAGTAECPYLTNMSYQTGVTISDSSSESYCEALSQMRTYKEEINYIAAYTTSGASTLEYCWKDKPEITNCVEIGEVCQNLNYKVPFTCDCEVLTACSQNLLYNPNTGTLTVDHICSCDVQDEISNSKTCDNICYCSSAKAQDDAAVVMHAYRCTIDSNNPRESYATLGYDGFYLTCVPFYQQEGSSSNYTRAQIGNYCNTFASENGLGGCVYSNIVSPSLAISEGLICCSGGYLCLSVLRTECINPSNQVPYRCLSATSIEDPSYNYDGCTHLWQDDYQIELFARRRNVNGIRCSCLMLNCDAIEGYAYDDSQGIEGCFKLDTTDGRFKLCNDCTNNSWARVLTECDAIDSNVLYMYAALPSTTTGNNIKTGSYALNITDGIVYVATVSGTSISWADADINLLATRIPNSRRFSGEGAMWYDV